MNSFMIVMLIWGGGGNGGPAVLPGFQTMQACEAAITIVQSPGPNTPLRGWRALATCVQLPIE